jgi:hypothetical protein
MENDFISCEDYRNYYKVALCIKLAKWRDQEIEQGNMSKAKKIQKVIKKHY